MEYRLKAAATRLLVYSIVIRPEEKRLKFTEELIGYNIRYMCDYVNIVWLMLVSNV